MTKINKKTSKKKTLKLNLKLKLAKKIKLEESNHSLKQVFESRYGKQLKVFGRVMLILFLVFAGLVSTVLYFFGQDLPDVNQLKDMDFQETTVIYDRDGNVLYSVFGEENRKYVPLNFMSADAINATLAIEDKNFFSHAGFDLVSIVRAQLNNLKEDRITQGASTITQQLTRNVFLAPEKTYTRKIKELLLSIQIEWLFTKNEILEMYLNKIAYGSNAFGIETAAKTFFGKSANELNLVESAILASLPKAPTYYSLYGQNKKELMGYCKVEVCELPQDPNYVWGRKDRVLNRMVEDGFITQEQMNQAWRDARAVVIRDPVHKIEAPHFVFYVKELIEKEYGKELIESGGLEIVTTLDPMMQSIAEEAVALQAQKNLDKYGANNAGLVAIDPKTGQILAMVGSVDYWNNEIDGQVNVTTSLRQPGSAFKPIIYATAIQNAGIGSGTILSDYKTVFNEQDIPINSDDKYKGYMNVRKALAWSRNIPAIKAYFLGGEEEEVLKTADKLGLTSLREFKEEFNSTSDERGWTFHYGWPMAIGSGEVRLLDLISAYGTFANGGVRMKLNPILEIRSRDGDLLELFEKDEGEQVIDPQVAFIINDILSDSNARPAGYWRNLLTIPDQINTAKTGTSNKKVDDEDFANNALTIGYTPSIVAGAWAGNTDGSQLKKESWGLTAAGPIWRHFMENVLADKPAEEFPEPEGLVWKGDEVFPGFSDFKNVDIAFNKVEVKKEDIPEPDWIAGSSAAAAPKPTSEPQVIHFDLPPSSF